jgi:hypothetical protein
MASKEEGESLYTDLNAGLARQFNEWRGADQSKAEAARTLMRASLNARTAFMLDMGKWLLLLGIATGILGIGAPWMPLVDTAAATITFVALGGVLVAWGLSRIPTSDPS